MTFLPSPQNQGARARLLDSSLWQRYVHARTNRTQRPIHAMSTLTTAVAAFDYCMGQGPLGAAKSGPRESCTRSTQISIDQNSTVGCASQVVPIYERSSCDQLQRKAVALSGAAKSSDGPS